MKHCAHRNSKNYERKTFKYHFIRGIKNISIIKPSVEISRCVSPFNYRPFPFSSLLLLFLHYLIMTIDLHLINSSL